MKPRLNFINLGVGNLERSLAFYRDGLGWPTTGIVGEEFVDPITGAAGRIAFFELQPGLMLGLYERANLAKDASVELDTPSSTEVSLGYAVAHKEDVDRFLQKTVAAGGVLTKKPHSRPWGVYSGYFKDIDGHLWEITWDPRIPIND